MSDVLLHKTFEDLEEFCINSKKSRIILSDRGTFPVYKMKIQKLSWREGMSITISRKMLSYDEEYEEYFRIRYNNRLKSISEYQVGIFYIPEIFDKDDPRNEFIPAIVFDKDKSIYDNIYYDYFDDGPILQDLLIKLLNTEREEKINE